MSETGVLLAPRPKLTERLKAAIGRVGAASHDPAMLPEHYASQPEIVSLVAGLLSEEAILSERATVENQLMGIASDNPEELRSKESPILKDKLKYIHTEPTARMYLTEGDVRRERIATLLLEAPRLGRGQWLPDKPKGPDRQLLIDASHTPLKIPLDNVVAAEGFTSWKGRKSVEGRTDKTSEYDGLTRTSSETVDYYAALGNEAPPLEEITGYVQPNGVVFYSVGSGAHRAAAALRRGDETLDTTSLKLYGIERNVLSLPASTEVEIPRHIT